MNCSELTAIVPTLNEGKNIKKLLGLITESYKGVRVIVADDGSTDGTVQIVKEFSRKNKNVSLLDRSNEKIKGLTASVIDAVKITKTQCFVVIDGDLQHPPEKIGAIFEKLGKADVVIGTRKNVIDEWMWNRKLMSIIATNLARLRLMRNIRDPMSGFFGVKRGTFIYVLSKKESKFEKKGYKVLFDLLKYLPKNSRIATEHYDFGMRADGHSKISRKHVLIFFRSLFK